MNNADTPIYIPWWYVIGGSIGASVFFLCLLLSLIWYFLAPDIDPNIREEESSLFDYYNDESVNLFRLRRARWGKDLRL